jgi:hypothetical protein
MSRREVFLSLGKFDVASGERSVVSLNASIERAIGMFDTFGGTFTIMSRPSHAGRSYASPGFSNAKFREDRSD